MALKTIFMGTPDFAAEALRRLIDDPVVDVVAVFTQPPRPKGRGQTVTPSPVQALAEGHGIPVHHPLSFKRDPDSIDQFKNYAPDVAVVAAYGLLLPSPILSAPRFGCLNIHASLLPRWRGASPIQHALLHGDAQTGITIMQMDAGLDTGPMIDRAALAIAPRMQAPQLHDALARLGADRIASVLHELARDGTVSVTEQNNNLATHAPKLTRAHGAIDWSRAAVDIDCQIRALVPWPGTHTHTPAGVRLRILAAQPATINDINEWSRSATPGTVLSRHGCVVCGDRTILQVTQLHPDHAKPMTVDAAINGGFVAVGDCLA